MIPQFGMPQGGEWLVILAIVILLFGSAKLPSLVRQLARSKKIWEEEVITKRDDDAELPADSASAAMKTPTLVPNSAASEPTATTLRAAGMVPAPQPPGPQPGG